MENNNITNDIININNEKIVALEQQLIKVKCEYAELCYYDSLKRIKNKQKECQTDNIFFKNIYYLENDIRSIIPSEIVLEAIISNNILFGYDVELEYQDWKRKSKLVNLVDTIEVADETSQLITDYKSSKNIKNQKTKKEIKEELKILIFNDYLQFPERIQYYHKIIKNNNRINKQFYQDKLFEIFEFDTKEELNILFNNKSCNNKSVKVLNDIIKVKFIFQNYRPDIYFSEYLELCLNLLAKVFEENKLLIIFSSLVIDYDDIYYMFYNKRDKYYNKFISEFENLCCSYLKDISLLTVLYKIYKKMLRKLFYDVFYFEDIFKVLDLLIIFKKDNHILFKVFANIIIFYINNNFINGEKLTDKDYLVKYLYQNYDQETIFLKENIKASTFFTDLKKRIITQNNLKKKSSWFIF